MQLNLCRLTRRVRGSMGQLSFSLEAKENVVVNVIDRVKIVFENMVMKRCLNIVSRRTNQQLRIGLRERKILQRVFRGPLRTCMHVRGPLLLVAGVYGQRSSFDARATVLLLAHFMACQALLIPYPYCRFSLWLARPDLIQLRLMAMDSSDHECVTWILSPF